MATVVVVLSGVCDRSSRPSLAAVMTASVVSGVISDTEPTKVVLPTPKPPATTIFTDVMAASATSPGPALELPKSTENPFEQVEVRAPVRVVHLVDPDQTLDGHVGDEDACHAEWHPEHRGDFRNCPPVPAEAEDGLTFRAQHRQVACLIVRRRHHRLDLQLIPRLGTAPGDGIGPDQSATAGFGRPVGMRVRLTRITRVGNATR